MNDNRYDEIYEPDNITISYDLYHELNDTIEEQKGEISNLQEDLEYGKEFIKKFIEEGNKEGQTLDMAYAKMFEYYKSKNYEEYCK